MDLQHFLSLERQQLQQERQRLSAGAGNNNNNNDANNDEQTCPAALLLQNENFVNVQCRSAAASSKCNEPISLTSSLATANQNSKPCTPRSYTGYTAAPSEVDCAASSVMADELHLDLHSEENADVDIDSDSTMLPKSAKEFVNQRELLLVGSARNYKSPNASPRQLASERRPLSEQRLPIRRPKGDDMEQWVTDTFYSYFPGFNNENQKRQNYLRERQRENQQNFLRHQMLHPPLQKRAREKEAAKQLAKQATSSSTASTTDKTDLELIVNINPHYAPPKGKSKPQSSNRHQMLQDLGHVELSNIVTGDGINERNLRSAELETARKKDYQRDLMQQIEEKRRAIEMFREKERRQEEALTRRLEAQLKTIHLEEQLEKQRLRAEKARMDAEHNQLMREQLLAKLEQDAQLLQAKQKPKEILKPAAAAASNANNNNSQSMTDTNKVYKYFSNSAHHEYRRGQPLPPAVELDFELPQMAKIERECFHLCEKICPLCDEPLKSYESCCLRCQRKLALKMKQRKAPEEAGQENEASGNVEYDVKSDAAEEGVEDHYCHSSYALVCTKCERLYALCTSCLAKSDVCRACQRERNVCMSCRRNLCSFCLEEIACGRDAERTHVNEQDDKQTAKPADAFRVLEVNYAVPDSSGSNKANAEAPPPPYSMNISRNSVFHADYQPRTPVKTNLEQLPTTAGSANTSFELDSADEQAMERVRRQTDQRLSRYLKNYGDLAGAQQRSKSESRHRGTQTTPQSTGRRDVVLQEAATHNLSMPLLREMPKMTRKETTLLAQTLTQNSQRKMENLKKRWEVPAVQKFTVSSSSPKILTQVGAIRKQLQAARFFDDDAAGDEEEDDEDY